MRHHRILSVGLAAAAGLVAALSPAGCATGTPATGTPATGTSAANGADSAGPVLASPGGPPQGPSPTPFVRPYLTTAGLGPYVVGARLDGLRTAGLVFDVQATPACPGISTAAGTAAYGRPALVFYQDALQSLRVTDPQVRTADGVQVGSSDAQVRARYAGASDLNTGESGRALIVQEGANGLLFRIDTKDLVSSIEAGLADPLQFRFTDGEGC